ncbi:MAG: 2-oxo acid dehydrogenase subunit E2 [Candidatus Heimdallarchaeaceae archaeon]
MGKKSNENGFSIVPFPKSRRIIVDLLEQGAKKHHVKALVEVDVTEARNFFKEYKEKTGSRLSFTGWVITCIAKAMDEHKEINAYKKGRNKIIIFDDVDVGIIVEREIEGKKVPRKYIIRQANKKSFLEIHNEIRRVQTQKIEGPVMGEKKEVKMVNLFASLPKFIRKIVWWWSRKNPHFRKRMLGTITVSSVGIFGRKGGWGIVMSSETAHFMIGGISKKPGVIDNKIEIREYLDLTIMIDHTLTDGGPTARFIQRLIDLLESKYGLDFDF